jgi:LmbE family N-acetylglucosaminyl deacetylase
MKRIKLILVAAAAMGLLNVSAFAKPAPALVFKNNAELQDDIDKGSTVMFVFVHPDDEVFVSGTIALVGGDKTSSCYICCLGSLDNVRREKIDVPSRLKAIRWITKKYLKDYIFLDNNFTTLTPKIINVIKPKLKEVIEEKKPDILITFAPSGYDGNVNHRLTSKIVTDIYPTLSYAPKLYFLINVDQELNFKAREYRKYPPTDAIDLNVHSEKLGKKLWDEKLEIWENYSDSTPIIMGVMARKERLDKNDQKEYFRKMK